MVKKQSATNKLKMPRTPDSWVNSSAIIGNTQTSMEEFFNSLSDTDRKALGSSVPYMTQMVGDWVINPSSVSLSTFQKMMYSDPTIGGALIYNFAIIAESVGEYYHEDKEKQSDIRKALRKIEGGLQALIRKMCSFMTYGFYIGERVSEYDAALDMDVVTRVLSLPQLSIVLAVDFSGRVKDDDGIFQYIFNMFNSAYANSLAYAGGHNDRGDITQAPDAWSGRGDNDIPIRTVAINPVGLQSLPRNKVIYLRNEGVDGLDNPYGRSLLRSVYGAYLMKAAISQFLMIALDRQGTPMVVCYADGTQSILGANDPNDTVDALSAIQDQLEAYRGTNVLLVPGLKGQVYDIDSIKISPDIKGFVDTLNWCEKQIQRGLLMPDTIFQGDSGGSYASNSMSNNVHNKLLAGIRNTVMHGLVQDVVRPMLESKYGVNLDSHGYFKEEILSLDDKLKIAKNYETLSGIGVISAQMIDDLNEMRESQNFSQLTDEEMNRMIEVFRSTLASSPKTNTQEVSDHYKNSEYGETASE